MHKQHILAPGPCSSRDNALLSHGVSVSRVLQLVACHCSDLEIPDQNLSFVCIYDGVSVSGLPLSIYPFLLAYSRTQTYRQSTFMRATRPYFQQELPLYPLVQSNLPFNLSAFVRKPHCVLTVPSSTVILLPISNIFTPFTLNRIRRPPFTLLYLYHKAQGIDPDLLLS